MSLKDIPTYEAWKERYPRHVKAAVHFQYCASAPNIVLIYEDPVPPENHHYEDVSDQIATAESDFAAVSDAALALFQTIVSEADDGPPYSSFGVSVDSSRAGTPNVGAMITRAKEFFGIE